MNVRSYQISVDELQTIVDGHKIIVNMHKTIVGSYKTIVNSHKITVSCHGTNVRGQVVSWHGFKYAVDISKNFVDEPGSASCIWVVSVYQFGIGVNYFGLR
ncbi:MAG: hypothetical protein DRI97_12020 [Bacteroidetes bacterium]|nr:MAG: hypothetical protein DRI97_12020 [Bacteroidota bacterium]